MATAKGNDKPSDQKTRKIIDVTEPGMSVPATSSRSIIVSNRPVLRQDPMMLSPDGMEKNNTEITPISRATKNIKVMPVSPLKSPQPEPEVANTPAEITVTPKVQPTPAPEPFVLNADSPAALQAADEGEAAPEVGKMVLSGREKVVQPLTPASEAPAATAAVSDAKVVPKAKAVEPEASVDTNTLPAAQTSVPDDEDDADGQLAPNQAIDQAKRKEDDEKLARLTEQEKIIESKQFYLPINVVEKRRSLDRVILLFVLVLLLALIWIDIVLDAGILRLGGIQPLTHFFHS